MFCCVLIEIQDTNKFSKKKKFHQIICMTSKIHVSKQVSLCASVLFVYGSTNNIERHQEMAIIVIHVDLFSLLFKVYCYVKNLLIKSL